MEPHDVPETPTGLACFMLDCGWSWSHDELMQCTNWLAAQGIKQELDLVELALSDLRGLDQWPRGVGVTCVGPFAFALAACVW